jgi:hypothetical protein
VAVLALPNMLPKSAAKPTAVFRAANGDTF